MAHNPKDQKTAILGETPPEVAQALQRRNAPQSQATMMMDGAQHPAPGTPQPQQQRQMVVPTMMRERPSGPLPPVKPPPKQSTAGRWIAGPILAAVVAAGTVAGANALLPIHGKGSGPAGPGKPQGHLKLQTDPPGAAVTVDGKPWNHFTPTVIDGDIGATVHIVFKLDGYETRDADIYIAAGEHPFNAKLLPSAPVKGDTSKEGSQVREHHHHSSTPKPVKEEGKASISIRVRPWAIVYVDGNKLRQTPVTDYQLPAGKHVIELINEGKNRREKINLALKNGDTQEISRDWDK